MNFTKGYKNLGITVLSVGVLAAMINSGININAAVTPKSLLISNTILQSTQAVNYTYIARDPFYDLNDKSVNRLSSEHFQIIWGNGDTTGTVNEALVRGNLENLETIRDFYVNVLRMKDTGVSVNDPVDASSTHYKTNIYINKTGLSKVTDDWAYMSDDGYGFAYLAVEPGAMRVDPPSWVLPHEYAHAITMHQRGNISAAWYETLANWFRDQYLGSSYYKYGGNTYGPTSDFFQPIVLNSDYYFPHMKNYYDAWPFLLYVSENPDNMNGLGMQLMKNMIKDTSDETMFDKFQRLSGTSTKDMLGGYARRMVTMDFKRQSSYLSYLNDLLKDSSNYDKIYTALENENNGWFKVPDSRAPMQGGYNIIPLNVDLSSKQVVINFKGNKSVSGADFRDSIVAKTKTGRTRYSTMWSTGTNTLNLQGDEEKVYLVVCATPDKMLDLTSFDVNAVGTRYPYEVQISTNNNTNTNTNVSLKAKASTSYCSDWENVGALNDGFDPSNSNDRAHAVYGNWPQTGTQWVQYNFDKKYTVSQCDVYWFKDNQGIDVPKSYKIQYYDAKNKVWLDVNNASGYGTEINKYNITTFTPVSTWAIRIQMTSNGNASTGILEWKVK